MGLTIANSIAKKKLKRIGVLGLSYKGDLKVSVLSKVIPLVKSLKKKKLNVKLFDPYFTKEEIKKAVNVETFKFPHQLTKFDCLIVTVNHKQFRISSSKLKKYLKNCKFIIDHEGAWQNYNLADKYYLTGASGWL